MMQQVTIKVIWQELDEDYVQVCKGHDPAGEAHDLVTGWFKQGFIPINRPKGLKCVPVSQVSAIEITVPSALEVALGSGPPR